MNHKILLPLVLFSIFGGMGGQLVAGEPLLGLKWEPKIRVTPIYYDLIADKDGKIGDIKIDDLLQNTIRDVEGGKYFREKTKEILNLQKNLAAFEEDLRSRLEENKKLPREIEELEKQQIGAALDPAAEQRIGIELQAKKKKLAENEPLLVVLPQEIKMTRQEIDRLRKIRTATRANAISGALQRIPVDKIKIRCREKRKELKRKQETLERDLRERRLGFSEQAKKREELIDVQFDLEHTAHACPLLLDPSRREAYDRSIATVPEEPKGLIEALRNGVQKAQDDPPDAFTSMNDLAGKFFAEDFKPLLQQIFGDIPEAATTVFNQNIALRSIDFLPKPSGQEVRYWVGFSGLMRFNRFELRASMYVIQDLYGITRVSFSVELPEYYKLSDLIPGFTYLDSFSLPRSRLIFSNFTYFDQIQIRKGMTLEAEVDLSGPLKILSDLKDKSSYFKSLVFENEPVILSGYIPIKNYLKSEFEIRVPFHFGFDFRKMSLMPKSVSNVINQVTSEDFRLTITPRETKRAVEMREERMRALEGRETLKETEIAKKIGEAVTPFYRDIPGVLSSMKKAGEKLTDFARFNIEAEAGARILLGTQPEPLSLTFLGAIRPTWDLKSSSLLAAANLKKMLQLKWLAIGNATIQFDWDAALMAAAAAVGLPFTGFGIRGSLDLGKPGESRASFDVAGGFNVTSKPERPALLFNVRGRNIRFTDILHYAFNLASKARILKAPIPVEKIPTITFEHVEGYASLSNMKIGTTHYPAGLGLHVETEFFKQKFGLKVDLSDDFRLSGFGYMPRVDFRLKGRDIFKLYDSSQPAYGPKAAFDFDPKSPLEGYFWVKGALEVPAMRLKHDVQFAWHGWMLDADFESAVAGISLMFGVRINTQPSEPIFGEMEPASREEEAEREPIEERFKRLPERLAKVKEMKPRWKDMQVRFAFKEDFAKYLTQTAVPLLQKMKSSALRKLNAAMEKMIELKARGVRGFEAEIERARRSVAKTEEKLQRAKETCTQARWYKKYVCAKVAAQQTILLTKKSYLNGLLKPTKVIATKATQLSAAAARKMVIVQEFALESALMGLEVVKAGFSLFRIKELSGDYTAREMAALKTPMIRRCVLEVFLFEGPTTITLENVQFDFSHPFVAVENLTMQLLKTALGKKMEYLEIMQRG